MIILLKILKSYSIVDIEKRHIDWHTVYISILMKSCPIISHSGKISQWYMQSCTSIEGNISQTYIYNLMKK